ncbi:MAG: hypothetical protein ABI690_15770 [Chloroflexota bacterium]
MRSVSGDNLMETATVIDHLFDGKLAEIDEQFLLWLKEAYTLSK